jgi:CheY-like chemotaxis protein
MKILILDDMENRHAIFRAQLKDHDLWHAYNGELAQKLIEEHTFDLMFLDHDLSEEHYPGAPPPPRGRKRAMDGRDVAQLVAALPKERQPKQVVVHSWNSVAAPQMLKILQEGGVRAVRRMAGWYDENYLLSLTNFSS